MLILLIMSKMRKILRWVLILLVLHRKRLMLILNQLKKRGSSASIELDVLVLLAVRNLLRKRKSTGQEKKMVARVQSGPHQGQDPSQSLCLLQALVLGVPAALVRAVAVVAVIVRAVAVVVLRAAQRGGKQGKGGERGQVTEAAAGARPTPAEEAIASVVAPAAIAVVGPHGQEDAHGLGQ